MTGKFCGASLARIREWQENRRTEAGPEVQPTLADTFCTSFTGSVIAERTKVQLNADQDEETPPME